jgi:hypothetical protein
MQTQSNFKRSAIALTALAWACLISVPRVAEAADPAPSATPANAALAHAPVKLGTAAANGVKRITLSAKAAERLDVQTGLVTEQVVVRKQMVSGMVVYPQAGTARPTAPTTPTAGGGFGGFAASPAAAPAADGMTKVALLAAPGLSTGTGTGTGTGPTPTSARGESWVVVNLSPGEFARIAKDKPARITPLYTRDKDVQPMLALPSGEAPIEDAKRAMLGLHYVLPAASHQMTSSTRVRVELQLAGTEDKQKVVPYTAVYYDAKGLPWVYVSTAPLTFERQRITVQRVVGPLAVVSDGPALGTQVVTVGASLLYGTEIFGK